VGARTKPRATDEDSNRVTAVTFDEDETLKGPLWKPSQVAIASLFGGPLGGGILLAINERRLGRGGRAVFFVSVGVVLTAALFAGRFYAPEGFWLPLTGVSVLSMWGLAVSLQGAVVRAHVEGGGRIASTIAAFGLGAAAGLFIVVVALALALLFWRNVMGATNRTFVGSCDMKDVRRPATSGAIPNTCWEFRVHDPARDQAGARRLCRDAWSSAPCDRANAVGGCRRPSGITFWYYPSSRIARRADVQLECAKSDADFAGADAPP
jgi:hypothetical protein